LSKCPFIHRVSKALLISAKDDTSIGHIANDKDSLQDLVNLDLAYLNDWSKRWLVKFNQNKTEIMVISILILMVLH
jgi:hypothetical protein